MLSAGRSCGRTAARDQQQTRHSGRATCQVNNARTCLPTLEISSTFINDGIRNAFRLSEKEQQLAGASANQLMLQDMVNQAEQKLRTLKKNYDSLLEELRLIDEHFRSQSLKQPTTCVYKDNEQRSVYQNALHIIAHLGTTPHLFNTPCISSEVRELPCR